MVRTTIDTMIQPTYYVHCVSTEQLYGVHCCCCVWTVANTGWDEVESKMQVAIFNFFTELILKCGNR